MAKVFISYSSKNKKIMQYFMEFLQLGMGVDKNNIFCTAFSESIVTGEAFIEKIRKKMQDCEAVISIITEEYLKNKFCLVEMGAAWAMSKQYFPLLLVPYERLNSTPLSGTQMRRLDQKNDVSVVYDAGISVRHQTAEFNKRLPEFITHIHKIQSGDFVIKKANGDYYEVTIDSVRKVKDNYRCYGIRGHIADPPDGEIADNDWLFFWRNVFPDLQIGDRVRFKTSKSKVSFLKTWEESETFILIIWRK